MTYHFGKNWFYWLLVLFTSLFWYLIRTRKINPRIDFQPFLLIFESSLLWQKYRGKMEKREKTFAHVALNNPLIYGTFKTRNHILSIIRTITNEMKWICVCNIKEIKNHINRIAKKLAEQRGYNYRKIIVYSWDWFFLQVIH